MEKVVVALLWELFVVIGAAACIAAWIIIKAVKIRAR